MTKNRILIPDYDQSPALVLQHFKVPVIITVFGVLLSSILFMWSITNNTTLKKNTFAEASHFHALSMKKELKSLVHHSLQFVSFFESSYHVTNREFKNYASQLINSGLIDSILYTSKNFSETIISGQKEFSPSEKILESLSDWKSSRIKYESLNNSAVAHIFTPIKKNKTIDWLVTTIKIEDLVKSSNMDSENFSGIKIIEPMSNRTLYHLQLDKKYSLSKNVADTRFDNITAFSFKDRIHLDLTELELIYAPAGRYLNQEQDLSAWLVLAMGLILTSLLSLIYFRSTSESLRINKEAQQIANKFHDSEVRLSHIIDQAVDAIFTLKEDGTIENINPACITMFGYSESDLIGKNINMLMHNNYFSIDSSNLENSENIKMEKIVGETRELNAIKKSGQEFSIELSVSEISFSNKRMLSGFIRDISDRKQILARMENAYKKLALVTDGSKDGFWHWTKSDNEKIECSDTFFELLGYSPQEFSPNFENFQLMLHSGDIQETLNAIDDSVKHKSTFDIQFRIQRKAGDYYWYRGRGTPYYSNGKFIEMAGSISDIEHIKVLENNLRNTNAELEQFAYIASHDLKEPVRTLNTFSTYLLEDFKSKNQKRIEQDVKYIQAASARMTILIDDLLELSRAGNTILNKTTLELTTVIEDVKNRLLTQIQDTGTHIDIELTTTEVLADSTSLGLVIQNLLQNAMKFQAKDNTPHIVISTEKNQAYHGAIIHIQDNGIGIEESQQEYIFGVFKKLHAQADYPGTGIGLTIVTKIIERHGGHIEVTSTPEKGSRFSIYLPKHT